MGMALTIPQYTIDDLARFPDDGNRYELLDGVLLVTPLANHVHQVIATRLIVALSAGVKDARVVGPGGIVFPPRTQLEPDVLVYPSRFQVNCKWADITNTGLPSRSSVPRLECTIASTSGGRISSSVSAKFGWLTRTSRRWR